MVKRLVVERLVEGLVGDRGVVELLVEVDPIASSSILQAYTGIGAGGTPLGSPVRGRSRSCAPDRSGCRPPAGNPRSAVAAGAAGVVHGDRLVLVEPDDADRSPHVDEHHVAFLEWSRSATASTPCSSWSWHPTGAPTPDLDPSVPDPGRQHGLRVMGGAAHDVAVTHVERDPCSGQLTMSRRLAPGEQPPAWLHTSSIAWTVAGAEQQHLPALHHDAGRVPSASSASAIARTQRFGRVVPARLTITARP